jgi:hypothetical protein
VAARSFCGQLPSLSESGGRCSGTGGGVPGAHAEFRLAGCSGGVRRLPATVADSLGGKLGFGLLY